MTDTHTHDIAKAKAEATFKRKEQQARDGAIAMAEYHAAQTALRAKTEHLRALRLAKEAADATADSKTRKKSARRS
jgi:hypothetical protein